MQSVAQIYIFFEKIQKQNKLLKISGKIKHYALFMFSQSLLRHLNNFSHSSCENSIHLEITSLVDKRE